MELNLSWEKRNLFIKTAVWNSILEFFLDKKWIDVRDFLVSIKISDNKIFVKTNKPIFNSEANIYIDFIKEIITKKFYKVWLWDYIFELKFI